MRTYAQDRILNRLLADPRVVRMTNRPMADRSVEAWCYDSEDVLLFIGTVFPDGNYAARSGFRPTTETWVGNRPLDD